MMKMRGDLFEGRDLKCESLLLAFLKTSVNFYHRGRFEFSDEIDYDKGFYFLEHGATWH
jgi:hypothetical protein